MNGHLFLSPIGGYSVVSTPQWTSLFLRPFCLRSFLTGYCFPFWSLFRDLTPGIFPQLSHLTSFSWHQVTLIWSQKLYSQIGLHWTPSGSISNSFLYFFIAIFIIRDYPCLCMYNLFLQLECQLYDSFIHCSTNIIWIYKKNLCELGLEAKGSVLEMLSRGWVKASSTASCCLSSRLPEQCKHYTLQHSMHLFSVPRRGKNRQ